MLSPRFGFKGYDPTFLLRKIVEYACFFVILNSSMLKFFVRLSFVSILQFLSNYAKCDVMTNKSNQMLTLFYKYIYFNPELIKEVCFSV